MKVYRYSIQWGGKPQLNKVKASGGCHRFSEEIYRAELDKSGRKNAKAHLIKWRDKNESNKVVCFGYRENEDG